MQYQRYNQSYHQNRPFIAMEDMLKHKQTIKKVYEIFTIDIERELKKNRGIIDNNSIEKSIQKSYMKANIQSKKKLICEGFFDTYLGFWTEDGIKVANFWAKNLIS